MSDRTPQQLAALAAQLVRGQGAPMTAENLNRAVLALTRGEDTNNVAFDMNAAVDRLAARTTRRPPLPQPAPATPRPNTGEVVAGTVPMEPTEEAPEPQPVANNLTQQYYMNQVPAMVDATMPIPEDAGDVDLTGLGIAGAAGGAAALLSPRVAALLARRNAAREAGNIPNIRVTLNDRPQPSTRNALPRNDDMMPRLPGPDDMPPPMLTGPGNPPPLLPGPTSASLRLPPPSGNRRQVSDMARQHREEVRENMRAARAEARERERILRELRAQVRADGVRGTVNVNREAMRRYEAMREGSGVAPPTVPNARMIRQ